MSRKLVTIQQIEKITPIKDADRIELVHIKGWQVISQKGLHSVGDFVIFHEIDTFIPEGMEPYAKDLNARGTRLGDTAFGETISGYLIKSLKLRGEISQGYLVPISSYNERQRKYFNKHLINDYDVTDFLELMVYQKPEKMVKSKPKSKLDLFLFKTKKVLNNLFPFLFKNKKFNTTFPSFISKTDCVRIQNYKNQMWDHYNNDTEFQVTYKLDGSSITVYSVDKKLGVCSRNLNKNMAEETDLFVQQGTVIHNKLAEVPFNYCVQGELLSPKIQGNFEGVRTPIIYIYSIWDIDKQTYINPEETSIFCKQYNLNHVPVLHDNITLKSLFPDVTDPDDLLNKLLAYADGPSGLSGKYREGLVYKQRANGFTAIKTISNKYLLKMAD